LDFLLTDDSGAVGARLRRDDPGTVNGTDLIDRDQIQFTVFPEESFVRERFFSGLSETCEDCAGNRFTECRKGSAAPAVTVQEGGP
jgi:hypothetical protein